MAVRIEAEFMAVEVAGAVVAADPASAIPSVRSRRHCHTGLPSCRKGFPDPRDHCRGGQGRACLGDLQRPFSEGGCSRVPPLAAVLQPYSSGMVAFA